MPEGATPLDDDEREGLLPTHLITQGQLDAWEQVNIVASLSWCRRRRGVASILDVTFLREMHRRMFGDTWRWAGTFRTTAKNIGVPADRIAVDLRDLLGDAQYWIAHATWSIDEIAVRFHHRLVTIHPFPNGNGRHARMATDVLLRSLEAPPFSWGATDLARIGDARAAYLEALRRADRSDYGPLSVFVRS